MNSLTNKPAKKPKKQYGNQNTIETLESIVSGFRDSIKEDLGKGLVTGVRDSVAKDLGKSGLTEAWDELLGTNIEQKSKGHEDVKVEHGDLSEGAELDLANLQEKTVEITEMGRAFQAEVINAGKNANAENSHEVQVKMQEILIEIKKLSESSQELKEQVEVISLEQTGEDLGIYHVNFLEKMLSFINDLRLNVEDSLAWFSSLRSKKASRQYHAQAKKHGTSFTLSGERQVSTQVG